MMWLAFIACLGSGECKRIEVGPVPAIACEMRGQLGVVEWLAAHPGYRVRGGWQCVTGRPA